MSIVKDIYKCLLVTRKINRPRRQQLQRVTTTRPASRMTCRALVGVPSRQLRDCVTNMGAGARIHVRESC